MTIYDLIGEIKTDLSSYDSAGLIDDMSIYKWVINAVKIFGENVMDVYDKTLYLDHNGRAKLPDNFFRLRLAYSCEPVGYNVKSGKVPQRHIQWIERTEREFKWEVCEGCISDGHTEKLITETLYFDDSAVDFYYGNIHRLRITKRAKNKYCSRPCFNKINGEAVGTIDIQKDYILSDLRNQYIYIQYKGLEQDEQGRILIPESTRGNVEQYIEYFVKMKFFEKLMANNDSENIATMFKYYIGKEAEYKRYAITDSKFDKITPDSFNKIKVANRMRMLEYESMFPNLR